MCIQTGQNHSMVSDLNLFIGAVKISNRPIKSIKTEIPRNFNSPIGDIPRYSISILKMGPFIGRKSNTRKIPSICLIFTLIREGTRFSTHSAHRIDLETTSARSVQAPVVKGLSQEVSNLLSRVRIPAGAPHSSFGTTNPKLRLKD